MTSDDVKAHISAGFDYQHATQEQKRAHFRRLFGPDPVRIRPTAAQRAQWAKQDLATVMQIVASGKAVPADPERIQKLLDSPAAQRPTADQTMGQPEKPQQQK